MSAIQNWVAGYLLNAAWQVPMIFGMAWLVARLARRMGMWLEHRVWVMAILLETLLPACPARPAELLRLAMRWFRQSSAGIGGQVRVTMGSATAVGHGILRLPADVQFGLLLVYGWSVLYFAGRLAWENLADGSAKAACRSDDTDG